MRKLFFLFTLLCIQAHAQEQNESPNKDDLYPGQDKNSFSGKGDIHIGIDVLKSLPSYIFNEKFLIQKTLVIDPVLLLHGRRARKSFVVSPGFTVGSTNKNAAEFISYEKFTGGYLKLGIETHHTDLPMSIGFGPIISFASFKGRYKFKGPAFGDYEGNFADNDNVAFGINGYVTYNVKFSERMFLRLLVQSTISFRTSEIKPFYFPGLGFTFGGGGPANFSPGFTAQLFYKAR